MSSQVYHHQPAGGPGAGDLAELVPADLAAGLAAVLGRLQPVAGAARPGPLAVRIPIAPLGMPAWVQPAWAAGVADALQAPSGSFCWDTLSITTRGLDTPEGLLAQAARQGFPAGGEALPFRVADALDAKEPETRDVPAAGWSLAPGLTGAGILAALEPVRSHPHLGFLGAVAGLGLGTACRAAKLRLHSEIRPRVDTPLCAGCGACLNVCLFDAIEIRAGRATIDHTRCTGCGECMSVCFMAGISDEDAAAIPLFQERVADAAVAAHEAFCGCTVHVNLLSGMERRGGGGGRKQVPIPGNLGVLASRDPVALDQATCDLVAAACGGSFHTWSGYPATSESLLNRAEKRGLGARTHRLIRV